MSRAVATTKRCSRCKNEQPTEAFRRDSRGRIRSWCRACDNAYYRAYRSTGRGRAYNRGYQRAYNAAMSALVDRYPEEFADLLAAARAKEGI